eukprot:TRINITY_DN13925_c0_g1_i1.p1 TRINITY_DN13925_c0_g1~~TRINITY_DN13925_c0_g1_i1.p1  ORF type:complete len:647 (+),score=196.67 TRINITY_DN13925_c0_g1_i1:103-2043(+)
MAADTHQEDETQCPPPMVFNPNAVPAKPSLKKMSEGDDVDRARRKSSGAPHVTWDEEAIAEHDKERGTRQKIDEPDTPFIRSPQQVSDEEEEQHAAKSSSAAASSSSSKAVGISLDGPPGAEDDYQARLSFRQPVKIGVAVAPGSSAAQRHDRSSSSNEGNAASSSSAAAASSSAAAASSSAAAASSSTITAEAAGAAGAAGDAAGPAADAGSSQMDPQALANRLTDWVKSGGGQRRRGSHGSWDGCSDDGGHADGEFANSGGSSRSSSSMPGRLFAAGDGKHKGDDEGGRRSQDKRISVSLPEDAEAAPKACSASFKAKRAAHYNEARAIKAAMSKKFGESDDESSGSSGSSAEEKVDLKTNTNTNVNQSIAKAPTPDRKTSRDDSDDKGTHVRRRTASFSGGESGGESSEEFRHLRRQHYANEYVHDRSVSEAVSSLETNTNTNLNAGACPSSSSRCPASSGNPMEAGRPPVTFGQDDGGAEVDHMSSEEFKGRRLKHYDEVAAVRKFKEEHGESPEELQPEGSSGEDAGSSPPSAPPAANPSEPRASAHVGFKVNGESPSSASAAVVSSSAAPAAAPPAACSGACASDAASASIEASACEAQAKPGGEDWKHKRNAHYSAMAAALRAMPPPSDDEDEDDEDEG